VGQGPLRRLWVVTAACALMFAAPVAATASTYKSPSQITIPAMGAASPYPASIAVSGLPGTVSNVRVTLGNFAHGTPPTSTSSSCPRRALAAW